jgi:hypothetical protein
MASCLVYKSNEILEATSVCLPLSAIGRREPQKEVCSTVVMRLLVPAFHVWITLPVCNFILEMAVCFYQNTANCRLHRGYGVWTLLWLGLLLPLQFSVWTDAHSWYSEQLMPPWLSAWGRSFSYPFPFSSVYFPLEPASQVSHEWYSNHTCFHLYYIWYPFNIIRKSTLDWMRLRGSGQCLGLFISPLLNSYLMRKMW